MRYGKNVPLCLYDVTSIVWISNISWVLGCFVLFASLFLLRRRQQRLLPARTWTTERRRHGMVFCLINTSFLNY